MSTIQKFLFVAAVASVPLFGSCKKDPVTCNYVNELQDESNALNAAATAYGSNPTTANCNAFKDAYQDYLNAADDYVDCATAAGQGAALQNAINDAQANLDALQC